VEVLNRADDEATVGSEDTERTPIEASVAVVNAAYGAPQRIAALAADLVAHREIPPGCRSLSRHPARP
jgi:type I restriction enzyme R subunit